MGWPFFVGVETFNNDAVLFYASELHLDRALEYKERTCTDQGKADGMIYGQSLPQVQDGESGKHGEGNNLLHRFKLCGRIGSMADSVRRNCKAIFHKCNKPANGNGNPQSSVCKFQMPVPRKSHENIGYY